MSEVLLPVQLRARLRDAPGLAWTAANAYAPVMAPRPGLAGLVLRLLTSAWVAPRLVYWLPLVVVAIQTGGLARIDRRALVLVNRDAPLTAGSVTKLAASVIVPAFLVFPWLWALPITTTQVWAGTVVLLAVLALDVGRVLWGVRQHGSTGPRRKELERAGAQVLDVGLYAAHPRGRRHGGQLLRALLPHVPASATLLASAATEKLAETYIERYQFIRYDPDHPFLLERRPVAPG